MNVSLQPTAALLTHSGQSQELGDAISARIVTLHVLISAKNIPRYQVFLAGVLACRLQRLEASMGKTGS